MMTEKKSHVVFAQGELAQIEKAALRTFECVASDFLQLIREAEGRDYITQAEVIEMVIDANRISTHGGLSRDLEAKVCALPLEARGELFQTFFPAKRYS